MDHFDESSPVQVLSPLADSDCSHSAQMIHNHGLQSVPIHEFLQDVASKVGRKYGRRNRLATTKLDIHCRSKDYSSSPITRQDDETRNDRCVTPHPRIQSTKYLSREVPRLPGRRRFAKPLAQRLFEADVFSTGTSPRPTSARPEDSAHTSSRRPLQFVTSLNLTLSLESRIYGNQESGRQGEAAEEDSISTADSEMLAVSEFSSSDASPTRDRHPVASLAHSSKSSNHFQTAAAQRARMGRSAGVLASEKKVPRAHGRKRGRAQVPPSPFEYAPLPLTRVRMHRESVFTRRQCGEYNVDPFNIPLSGGAAQAVGPTLSSCARKKGDKTLIMTSEGIEGRHLTAVGEPPSRLAISAARRSTTPDRNGKKKSLLLRGV